MVSSTLGTSVADEAETHLKMPRSFIFLFLISWRFSNILLRRTWSTSAQVSRAAESVGFGPTAGLQTVWQHEVTPTGPLDWDLSNFKVGVVGYRCDHAPLRTTQTWRGIRMCVWSQLVSRRPHLVHYLCCAAQPPEATKSHIFWLALVHCDLHHARCHATGTAPLHCTTSMPEHTPRCRMRSSRSQNQL